MSGNAVQFPRPASRGRIAQIGIRETVLTQQSLRLLPTVDVLGAADPGRSLRKTFHAGRNTPGAANTSSYEPGASSYPRKSSFSRLLSVAGTPILTKGITPPFCNADIRASKRGSVLVATHARLFRTSFNARGASRASAGSRGCVRHEVFRMSRRDVPS